jgi:hypothetical protein
MEGNQVYATMNGPTEFDVIGTLRTWDRRPDLGRIDVPTLATCGRYDEITPDCSETIVAGIPDARMVVFEGAVPTSRAEAYAATVEGSGVGRGTAVGVSGIVDQRQRPAGGAAAEWAGAPTAP